ncbi:MAG: DUF1553 domain-containing protein, partial [Planctomycetaceae bacterium]|nr:DUF1553 domain-containing protein [Planctomycetaceae bacterium]
RPGERGPLPLTDKVIEPELERIEGQLRTLEDETRRAASQSMADYWDRRHELARAWVKKSPDSPPAEGVHPVDAFIHAKIRNAHQSSDLDSQQSQLFHDQVLPILRDHCFRCHGDKNKGDLRLNSRDAILKAGESGQAAVIPGDPHASGLMEQVRSGAMPPTDTPLTTEQIATLERWIVEGATWPNRPVAAEQLKLAAVIDDQKFVRRAYLDAIGLPPNPSEVRSFLADPSPDKRRTLIKHLLNSEAVADHWMSYWQDVLAENPTLINQSMGSTGPFRWFLHDSLRDRKAMDRMVTELVMMRGSAETGGSAAFGMSGESDAPLAAKSHILSGAFLGIDLQCARCHDSPYHSTLQRDLYSMAAMLDRKVVTVPASSRVPAAFFERKGRQPLIEATLKPDEPVPPVWPFQDLLDQGYAEQLSHILQDSDDTREQFAVMLTSPFNRRFPRVLVNRVWKRLMGAGMVEPVHDWEGRDCSHPELMDWLADELVRNDYDLMSIVHIVMTSECYMREALGANLESTASGRFFNAPDRRRLTAEQIVDSLFAATGRKMETEELTFVYDGQRALGHRQTLGQPTRAWMFASLNNERDRPSLALPGAQSIVDVLEAFGWNGNRQQPIQVRESDPNVLQPGILANGSLTAALSRASFQSEVARLALESASPDELVEEWFLRLLSRYPTDRERILFSEALSQGFSNRVLTVDPESFPKPPETLPLVTWFNHLRSETTVIQQEHERRVKQGPPTDPRLETKWREIYEDFIWSLINHGEFVWVP